MIEQKMHAPRIAARLPPSPAGEPGLGLGLNEVLAPADRDTIKAWTPEVAGASAMKTSTRAWWVVLGATSMSCGEAPLPSSSAGARPASSASVERGREEDPRQDAPGADDGAPTAEPPASSRAVPPVGSARVIVGGAGGLGSGVPDEAAVVAAMVPAFRQCYERALKDSPTIRGAVRVTARVDATGRVSAANPTVVEGLPSALVSCVVARVSAARFAPPPGASSIVVIPVAFDR
jgi:hypothetical protein